MSNSVVPLLDLRSQYQTIRNEVEAAVLRVCESQQLILGPEVEEFEKAAAEYCRSRYAVGVSSGTDALLLALMALDIGRDDEVITSPYTFFATVGSIARVGARPVFADIEPDSFNINIELVEKLITPKTKAIMPVHLFGQCVEMEPLRRLAAERGIAIIEDAAQAIGAEYCGNRAGAMGTAGCFSFFPSKNLGAFGDAGLVTTDSEALFEKLRALRVHGGVRRYYHEMIGGNFRIDAIQAAVLRVKLPHLDTWTAGRQRNAAIYRELFASAGLCQRVALPPELPARRHIYNQFVVRADERNDLAAFLAERGVGNAVYYPLPLHLQACFSYLGYKKGDFPVSEAAAEHSLALPIFPELERAQLEHVVAVISDFWERQS